MSKIAQAFANLPGIKSAQFAPAGAAQSRLGTITNTLPMVRLTPEGGTAFGFAISELALEEFPADDVADLYSALVAQELSGQRISDAFSFNKYYGAKK